VTQLSFHRGVTTGFLKSQWRWRRARPTESRRGAEGVTAACRQCRGRHDLKHLPDQAIVFCRDLGRSPSGWPRFPGRCEPPSSFIQLGSRHGADALRLGRDRLGKPKLFDESQKRRNGGFLCFPLLAFLPPTWPSDFLGIDQFQRAAQLPRRDVLFRSRRRRFIKCERKKWRLIMEFRAWLKRRT
jgi:hypothetical protein